MFLATTSHSTSKQTAKCRRAEAAGLLVKRTSVASMMRSGLTLGLFEFIEQEYKSLIHLKGLNLYFGKGVEADLKASSEIAEDAGVNYPPVLDDQAVEEPMEREPVIEEEVDVDDEDNKELLPSVDKSRVPSIFRQQIARVLPTCDPECLLKKSPSNQYGYRTTGSANFPWKSIEHNWPFTRQRPATFADFLLPQFGRLRFFAPDKVMPHVLPNGRMPCE
jgi:hypothetical protein